MAMNEKVKKWRKTNTEQTTLTMSEMEYNNSSNKKHTQRAKEKNVF